MLYIECGKCDGAVSCDCRPGFRPEIKQHRKGLIDKSNEKGLLYLKDIADLPANYRKSFWIFLERGEYRRVGSEIWEPFTAHLIVSCKDISEIRTDGFDRRLYDLLSHNIVRIPPLRECPADIVSNAEQMAEKIIAGRKGSLQYLFSMQTP